MALRALTEHTHATSKAGCKSKTRHTTIVTGENKSDRHTAESVRVNSFTDNPSGLISSREL